jgi:hypothetical protein
MARLETCDKRVAEKRKHPKIASQEMKQLEQNKTDKVEKFNRVALESKTIKWEQFIGDVDSDISL